MPFFRYKALTRSGSVESGDEAAESRAALVRDLERRGLFVSRVRRKLDLSVDSFTPRSRIGDDEVLLLVQELTSLLRAGLSVTEALEASSARPGAANLQHVLERVLADVRAGTSLSAACASHPEAFDSLLVAALRTGERSGDLVPVFERYQSHLRRRIDLKRRVGQALVYPALLVVLLVAVLGILFVFVIPRFVALYADMDAQLPAPTRVLIAVVERGPLIATAVAIALAAGWAALRVARGTEEGARRLDRIRLRLPVMGVVFRLQLRAQVARTLETLLGAGMTVVDALRVAAESTTSRVYASRLRRVGGEVMEGRSLADAFADAGIFSPLMTRLVAAGESSGDLRRPLGEVALHYEERVDHRVARVVALAEPALMLLMGVFVGAIIIVTYLPIFSMAEVVR